MHNLLFSAFGKDFCLRNFYKLTNSDFFQRTELRSVEICVERCIDNIEYCRAILFVKENNKVCFRKRNKIFKDLLQPEILVWGEMGGANRFGCCKHTGKLRATL